MIGVKINYEGNTLIMSLPTDELADHLGSIGIVGDIPVGGTENIGVKIYADNDLMERRRLNIFRIWWIVVIRLIWYK